ncbi:MFS transporter [Salinigranum salinum]|uniref:MFS transporter n=1 Tax=Salinigranum salinum TaxID=1364937 RepID=UPI0012606FD5|nr:MFS transporter [Salinigranum salinum]
MRFLEYVKNGEWSTVLGYLLFVVLMAAGYYYNITFVQLGLIDLGTRLVGMSGTSVSTWMAALALLTFLVAVGTGVTMDRRNWSTDLRTKLRVLLLVVVVQFALTTVAPGIRTVSGFGVWIVIASVALGVGFPISFSLTIDFIPVPDRGYVAAVITAVTYFVANAVPLDWSIEVFSRMMLVAMGPGIVVLAVLASDRIHVLSDVVDELSLQHREFGRGRFCRPAPIGTRSLAFFVPVVLMFGVFFIDSLGFLRIIETPALVLTSWQSPSITTRLSIAVVHAIGALMAGVLYVNFDRNGLFLWVFALFGFTYVLYTSDLRMAALFPTVGGDTPSIVNPLFYSLTVSFYTTLNFALWPDLSTAETIGTHSAVGIGMAGWLATFLSTAVALYLEHAEYTLLSHLNLVNALALLLFFGLAAGIYVRRMVTISRGRSA